ncbi:hypothetical protein EG329_011519 [Mollisiaceae sp. DMI_Dod_QoI]|nr:hypothetical protein EG329_011519 [Helotiales sp. DMI_Dod_QoI]
MPDTSSESEVLTPAAASRRRSKKAMKEPTLWNSHKLVTLYAGTASESRAFVIHKDFATYHSPVLKAAFDSDFIEGQKQEYRFEDDFEEDVVRLLAHWFYTSILSLSQINGLSWENETSMEAFTTQSRCLIKLYVLADRLLIPTLQNQVLLKLDELAEKRHTMAVFMVPYVYENTGAESPLRQWMVWMLAIEIAPNVYARESSKLPHSMLMDIITLLSETHPSKSKLKKQKDMAEYMVDVV